MFNGGLHADQKVVPESGDSAIPIRAYRDKGGETPAPPVERILEIGRGDHDTVICYGATQKLPFSTQSNSRTLLYDVHPSNV